MIINNEALSYRWLQDSFDEERDLFKVQKAAAAKFTSEVLANDSEGLRLRVGPVTNEGGDQL